MLEKNPQSNIDAGSERILKQAGFVATKDTQGHDVFVPKDINTSTVNPGDSFDKIKEKIVNAGKSPEGINQFVNLFNYYLTSVLETKTLRRNERYDQMDFIIENDPAISLTRRVLRDETIQNDVFDKPIKVVAKKARVRKLIEKFFDSVGVLSHLPETINNLVSYGDAFWLLDINGKNGVTKLIPTDPRDVRQRFEFSIAELKKNKVKLFKKFNAYQILLDMASKMGSNASQFNKFLLGFQVLDSMFPFWQVLHFRRFTTRKNIEPFGMPFFYESQSEARMYLNSKIIINMIRSSAFIREHIQVKTSEHEDPTSQWDKVQEVKQMMELMMSSTNRSSKNVPSYGDRLYYPAGLIDVQKHEAGFNLRDRYEDLKMQREDSFLSTGLPSNYFSENSQYINKDNLMSQDRKTARAVHGLQKITIDQLIKLVEVHFSYTEEFDPYEEEFAISLPYPIPAIDEGTLNLHSSKSQYALGLIDQLKQSLQIARLPVDVVQGILKRYLDFSPQEIDKLIYQMSIDIEKEDAIGYSPIGARAGDPFLNIKKQTDAQIDSMDMQQQMMMQQQGSQQPEGEEQKQQEQLEALYEREFYEKVKDKNLPELIEEVIYSEKLDTSVEFLSEGRHFLSNKIATTERNFHVTVNNVNEKIAPVVSDPNIRDLNESVKKRGSFVPLKAKGLAEAEITCDVNNTVDVRYRKKSET